MELKWVKIANLVIQAMGKLGCIKFFNDYDEAVRWLKVKKPSTIKALLRQN